MTVIYAKEKCGDEDNQDNRYQQEIEKNFGIYVPEHIKHTEQDNRQRPYVEKMCNGTFYPFAVNIHLEINQHEKQYQKMIDFIYHIDHDGVLKYQCNIVVIEEDNQSTAHHQKSTGKIADMYGRIHQFERQHKRTQHKTHDENKS